MATMMPPVTASIGNVPLWAASGILRLTRRTVSGAARRSSWFRSAITVPTHRAYGVFGCPALGSPVSVCIRSKYPLGALKVSARPFSLEIVRPP